MNLNYNTTKVLRNNSTYTISIAPQCALQESYAHLMHFNVLSKRVMVNEELHFKAHFNGKLVDSNCK